MAHGTGGSVATLRLQGLGFDLLGGLATLNCPLMCMCVWHVWCPGCNPALCSLINLILGQDKAVTEVRWMDEWMDR